MAEGARPGRARDRDAGAPGRPTDAACAPGVEEPAAGPSPVDGAELAAAHPEDEPGDDERRGPPGGGRCGADTRRLGLARLLIDPVIEEAISAFVASAPPLPEDRRARLARLLRTGQCHNPADSEES